MYAGPAVNSSQQQSHGTDRRVRCKTRDRHLVSIGDVRTIDVKKHLLCFL